MSVISKVYVYYSPGKEKEWLASFEAEPLKPGFLGSYEVLAESPEDALEQAAAIASCELVDFLNYDPRRPLIWRYIEQNLNEYSPQFHKVTLVVDSIASRFSSDVGRARARGMLNQEPFSKPEPMTEIDIYFERKRHEDGSRPMLPEKRSIRKATDLVMKLIFRAERPRYRSIRRWKDMVEHDLEYYKEQAK